MSLSTLVQVSYVVTVSGYETFRDWTLGFDAAETQDVVSRDPYAFRPRSAYNAKEFGSTTAETKQIDNAGSLLLTVGYKRVVTPGYIIDNSPLAPTVVYPYTEICRLYVPVLDTDDYDIPQAFALPTLTPALPAFAMTPTPTHLLCGGNDYGQAPVRLACSDFSARRPEVIDQPYYLPARERGGAFSPGWGGMVMAPIGGPIDEEVNLIYDSAYIMRRLGDTYTHGFEKVLTNVTGHTAYFSRFYAFPPVQIVYLFGHIGPLGTQTCTARFLSRDGVLSSPVSISTHAMTPVVIWSGQYYYDDSSWIIDIESSAPANAVGVAITVSGGSSIAAVVAPHTPSFTASACRNAHGGVWFPGALIGS